MMKHLIPILVAGATVTVAITTAVAQAHGAFTGNASLKPYLYGYGAAAFLLLLAVATAIHTGRQESKPNASITQKESKHKGGVTVGEVTAHGEIRSPFPITDRDPRVTIKFHESPQRTPGLKIRPVRLRNDGGTDAYRVQVQTITLSAGYAEFQEIPQLRRDQSEIVEVKILDPSTRKPVPVHDVEMLLDAEVTQSHLAHDWSPLEVKCVITYRDYAERHFITHVLLSRDVAKDLTSAKDYKFFELRLAKASRFSFLKRWMCAMYNPRLQ